MQQQTQIQISKSIVKMNSSIYKLLLWVFQVAGTIKVVALDTLLGLEPKPQVQAPNKQTATLLPGCVSISY